VQSLALRSYVDGHPQVNDYAAGRNHRVGDARGVRSADAKDRGSTEPEGLPNDDGERRGRDLIWRSLGATSNPPDATRFGGHRRSGASVLSQTRSRRRGSHQSRD
jgi:hypothetical protein